MALADLIRQTAVNDGGSSSGGNTTGATPTPRRQGGLGNLLAEQADNLPEAEVDDLPEAEVEVLPDDYNNGDNSGWFYQQPTDQNTDSGYDSGWYSQQPSEPQSYTSSEDDYYNWYEQPERQTETRKETPTQVEPIIENTESSVANIIEQENENARQQISRANSMLQASAAEDNNNLTRLPIMGRSQQDLDSLQSAAQATVEQLNRDNGTRLRANVPETTGLYNWNWRNGPSLMDNIMNIGVTPAYAENVADEIRGTTPVAIESTPIANPEMLMNNAEAMRYGIEQSMLSRNNQYPTPMPSRREYYQPSLADAIMNIGVRPAEAPGLNDVPVQNAQPLPRLMTDMEAMTWGAQNAVNTANNMNRLLGGGQYASGAQEYMTAPNRNANATQVQRQIIESLIEPSAPKTARISSTPNNPLSAANAPDLFNNGSYLGGSENKIGNTERNNGLVDWSQISDNLLSSGAGNSQIDDTAIGNANTNVFADPYFDLSPVSKEELQYYIDSGYSPETAYQFVLQDKENERRGKVAANAYSPGIFSFDSLIGSPDYQNNENEGIAVSSNDNYDWGESTYGRPGDNAPIFEVASQYNNKTEEYRKIYSHLFDTALGQISANPQNPSAEEIQKATKMADNWALENGYRAPTWGEVTEQIRSQNADKYEASRQTNKTSSQDIDMERGLTNAERDQYSDYVLEMTNQGFDPRVASNVANYAVRLGKNLPDTIGILAQQNQWTQQDLDNYLYGRETTPSTNTGVNSRLGSVVYGVPGYNADGTPNETMQAILNGEFTIDLDAEGLTPGSPAYEVGRQGNASRILHQFDVVGDRDGFTGITVPESVKKFMASSQYTALGAGDTSTMKIVGVDANGHPIIDILDTSNKKNVETVDATAEELVKAVDDLIAANKSLQDMISAGLITRDDVMYHFFKGINPVKETESKSSYRSYGGGGSSRKSYSSSSGRRSYGGYSGGGSNYGYATSQATKDQKQTRINNIMKNWTF